jgi:hypothetical protein
MMELVQQLIHRYRRSGVVVDTNILLLYLIGRFAPDQITRFKRTDTFSVEDFRLLSILLSRFERLLTTPNILAEVSNLAAQLGEPLRSLYFQGFKTEIELLHEQYIRSRDAARGECFVRLGLTDAGIHILARQSPHLVLTVDLDLYVSLLSQGLDAINFNHIRPLGWKWLT